MVSLLLVIVLVAMGTSTLASTGSAQTTMGPAGTGRLTHAIALHGMQVLPVIALWLAAVPEAAARLSAMRGAAVGYTLLLAWAVWQAFAGRAPEALTLPSGLVLIAGVALLSWPVLRRARTWAAPREGHATRGVAR